MIGDTEVTGCGGGALSTARVFVVPMSLNIHRSCEKFLKKYAAGCSLVLSTVNLAIEMGGGCLETSVGCKFKIRQPSVDIVREKLDFTSSPKIDITRGEGTPPRNSETQREDDFTEKDCCHITEVEGRFTRVSTTGKTTDSCEEGGRCCREL